HGLRAELPGGGPDRVGGLQRMPALHAPVALRAFADVDAKVADDRPLDGQILVVLRHDAPLAHPAATVRTPRRQPRVVAFVNVRGKRSMCAPSIGRAALAAGSLRVGFRKATRKWSGQSMGFAACGLELLSQPFVFTAETIAFDLRPSQVFAQAFDLARLIVDDPLRVRRRRIRRTPRHAAVMPERRSKYKPEIRDSRELTR